MSHPIFICFLLTVMVNHIHAQPIDTFKSWLGISAKIVDSSHHFKDSLIHTSDYNYQRDSQSTEPYSWILVRYSKELPQMVMQVSMVCSPYFELVGCGPSIRMMRRDDIHYFITYGSWWTKMSGYVYGVNPDGDTVFRYVPGKIDSAQTYYDDGTLKEQKCFKNERRIGLTRYYHPNGRIKSVGRYTMEPYVDSCFVYDTLFGAAHNGKDSFLTFPLVDYYKKGIWFYFKPNGLLQSVKYHKLQPCTDPTSVGVTGDFYWMYYNGYEFIYPGLRVFWWNYGL